MMNEEKLRWTETVFLMAAIIAFCLLVYSLTGCAGLPPVEACYYHEKYGWVCVEWTGSKASVKWSYAPALTEADELELKRWAESRVPPPAGGAH